jgi:hypothetical protein
MKKCSPWQGAISRSSEDLCPDHQEASALDPPRRKGWTDPLLNRYAAIIGAESGEAKNDAQTTAPSDNDLQAQGP